MAVLIEAISVIVRTESIREKFDGECHAFMAKCPNKTLCADSALVRDSFDVYLNHLTGELNYIGRA